MKTSSSSPFLFDPKKYAFYDLVTEYFSNPNLQKVKDDQEFSIYVCKMETLLLNECRYLVVIIHSDKMAIGTIRRLSELKWVSLQTRILQSDTYFNVVSHAYQIQNSLKFHFAVKQKSTAKDKSVYVFENNEYPVDITLLHLKGNLYEYPMTGSFISCLETYQTVLTFHT